MYHCAFCTKLVKFFKQIKIHIEVTTFSLYYSSLLAIIIVKLLNTSFFLQKTYFQNFFHFYLMRGKVGLENVHFIFAIKCLVTMLAITMLWLFLLYFCCLKLTFSLSNFYILSKAKSIGRDGILKEMVLLPFFSKVILHFPKCIKRISSALQRSNHA